MTSAPPAEPPVRRRTPGRSSGSRVRRLLRPFPLVTLGISVAMCGLIVYPLYRLLAAALFRDGQWRVGELGRELVGESALVAARNALVVVIAGGCIALLVAFLFAWANERTDARIGWVGDVLPLMPMFVPPIAAAVGWTFLASPHAGYVNVVIRWLLPFDVETGPLNIFSWPGLILVYVLYLVPFAYIVISGALRNVDVSYEEAARTSGASAMHTLRHITLPSVFPGIASAALLVVIQGIALFSVPVIIGTRAEIPVLPVEIVYSITREFPPRYDTALALSLVLVALVGAVWLLQRRLSAAGLFAQVGGKGQRTSPLPLGRWRGPVRALMVTYLVGASVLPALGLVLVSLQAFWSPTINWGALSFNWYREVFANSFTRSAFYNSIVLAALAATAIVVIGVAVNAATARRAGTGRRVIDGITKMPGALPNVALAVGVLLAFVGPPFNLSGTMLVLLLAFCVIYFPHASVTIGSAYDQVGGELSEASAVAGAGSGRTLRSISLPLMTSGLVGAWGLSFVLASGDIVASSMLAGTRNPVVGFAVLDLWQNGTYPQLAALATLITIVSSTVVSIVLLAGRRRATRSR